MKYSIKLTEKQFHELLKERDALRADLEAAAVLLDRAIFFPSLEGARQMIRQEARKVLARPGVKALLPKK